MHPTKKRKTNTDSSNGFSSLVEGPLAFVVFSFFEDFDLFQCSYVCKGWNNICSNNDIWRQRYIRKAQITTKQAGIQVGNFREWYLDRFGRDCKLAILLETYRATDDPFYLNRFQHLAHTTYWNCHSACNDRKFELDLPFFLIDKTECQSAQYQVGSDDDYEVTQSILTGKGYLYSQKELARVKIVFELNRGYIAEGREHCYVMDILVRLADSPAAQHLCIQVPKSQEISQQVWQDLKLEPDKEVCRKLMKEIGEFNPQKLIDYIKNSIDFALKDAEAGHLHSDLNKRYHPLMTVETMLPLKQAYINKYVTESKNSNQFVSFRESIMKTGLEYFKTDNNNNNNNNKQWAEKEVYYYNDLQIRASGELRKAETLSELKSFEGIPPNVVTLVEKTIFYGYKSRVGVLQTYLQGGDEDIDENYQISYANNCCFALPNDSGGYMEFDAYLQSNSDSIYQLEHQMEISTNGKQIATSDIESREVDVELLTIQGLIKQCPFDVSELDFLVYLLACNQMLFDIVDGSGSESKDLWLLKSLRDSRVEQLFGTQVLAHELKAIKDQAKEIKRENGWDGRHHPQFTLWEYAEDDYCVTEDEDESEDDD